MLRDVIIRETRGRFARTVKAEVSGRSVRLPEIGNHPLSRAELRREDARILLLPREEEEEAPEEFVSSYLEAALWSSTDEDGKPLDDDYGTDDLAESTLAEMRDDCNRFWRLAGRLIDAPSSYVRRNQYTARDMAGHDFWLTRNGHGAGFWDGDWSDWAEPLLTALAGSFGEYNLMTTDDVEEVGMIVGFHG
jgi:hypothetical protein